LAEKVRNTQNILEVTGKILDTPVATAGVHFALDFHWYFDLLSSQILSSGGQAGTQSFAEVTYARTLVCVIRIFDL